MDAYISTNRVLNFRLIYSRTYVANTVRFNIVGGVTNKESDFVSQIVGQVSRDHSVTRSWQVGRGGHKRKVGTVLKNLKEFKL